MGRISLAAVLLIGFGSACAFAQTPASSSTDQDMDSVGQQSSSHAEEEISAGDSQERFTGLLDGSGLISTDSDKGLIFSAAVGGGWDSNPTGSSDAVSSSIYSVSPYIAFHRVSPKSEVIVQYQPTFLGYSSDIYVGQLRHAASVQMDGRLSERLGWNINMNGSYGENGSRLAAPLPSVAVGKVPGTETSAAAYLPGSGFVTYVLTSLGADYRKSERSRVAIDIWNSYSRVSGFDQAGGTVTGRLRYSYDLSPTLSLMAYAQASHFYGDLNCEGIGAGGGIDWKLGMNSTLSLKAGPQINTDGCGDRQGYSYSVEYSTRLSSRAQLYLRASRLPMVSYLGPGVWQRDASGGVQYRVTRRALLRGNVGYSSSTTLVAVSSYSGISIGASYDVQLKHNFSLSYGYRGYFADSAGTGYKCSLAQVSLKWTSNSGKTFQSQ